jgi:hypothetical protein
MHRTASGRRVGVGDATARALSISDDCRPPALVDALRMYVGGFGFVLRSGIDPSRRGRYEFPSPSSFIAAGSSTSLISVASISTATARPTPSWLTSSCRSEAKIANTAIIRPRRS